MNNSEAIEIIRTALAEVEWEYPMEYAAAFDMAIKALEMVGDAEQVTRCKDCANCFILSDGRSFTCNANEIDYYAPAYDAATFYCADGKGHFCKAVERESGKWIYDPELYPHGNGRYDCDQCGESVQERTNFCPNCGADMRGDGGDN